MEYELAKELEDAGFPHRPNGSFIYPSGDISISPYNAYLEGDGVYCPILSELIEACGDELEGIRRNHAPGVIGWVAERFEKNGQLRYVTGSTPEEAVAMLYLSLHEKTRTSVEGG